MYLVSLLVKRQWWVTTAHMKTSAAAAVYYLNTGRNETGQKSLILDSMGIL